MDDACIVSFTTAIVLLCLRPRFSIAQSNNPCETSRFCGSFGMCSSSDSPICSCLPGFYPSNNEKWNSGNWSSGCERRVPLSCQGDGFLKLEIMMYTDYSERWFGPTNQCESRCLANCSCLAYGFHPDSGCMLWSGTLIDIQKISAASGSNIYIRLPISELDHKKGSKKLVIILVVVGFVVVSICTYLLWKLIVKRRGKKKIMEGAESGVVDSSLQDALDQVNLQDLPLFKFDIIANSTNNFAEANKLGKGGFGPVYKGELNGTEIAVKRLSEASKQGVQEFMNEVVLISKLQHRNLVRLLGCCTENKETMLIYEYMPNKSLDFFLFDPSRNVLDWRKRFDIILGTCRGLLYLHRDSRLKIIHRDLKPSNILLDKDLKPKISDFGLARIYGTNQDHVRTMRVVGTFGYMAPEYAMEGKFSEKSDVFSFGVLVLEIVTGRRNTSFYGQDDHSNLMGHVSQLHIILQNGPLINSLVLKFQVWKLWTEDNLVASIDPRILRWGNEAEVIRCIHIGLLCVQELPNDRPSIASVLSMLSSEIAELPPPKRCAYTVRPDHKEAGTSSSKSGSSLNNVSITMLGGR